MNESVIKVTNGIPRHPAWRMAEPVNIVINRGEQIAIVGGNASGKSRLVEILTGHYPLLSVGNVHYNFPPDASPFVSDNIKYVSFRDSYGTGDSTYYYQKRWNHGDRCDEDSPLISLSSGELRKHQLAKALATSPRVLILDNPFIGLDVQARNDFRRLLENLIRETELIVILVLSRRAEIPDFITHVFPVEDLRVLSKMTLKEYKVSSDALPKSSLSRGSIQALPSQERIVQEERRAGQASPILRFHDVGIRYGERIILQPLDWTVCEGERWSLAGPNGSGKSTLLSLVCADNPMGYACDIELFGRRRGTGESIWEIKRHIGYVSPEMHRAYMKNIPAIDVVASGLHDSIGLYVRPKPGQRGTCLEWMRVFGIESLADRPFLQLSSGEQRLCLLVRAFVKDPELLILDEPLHGLDDDNSQLVRAIIDEFCSQPRKTLIMVTHYEEELPKCITHRLFLENKV